jgi:hypothetical protein
MPRAIDFNDAQTNVVLVLVSQHIERDPAWEVYLRQLLESTAQLGLTSRVIPVAVDGKGLELLSGIQAIRWDAWGALTDDERRGQLLSTITYDLCRMMRTYLAHLEHPDTAIDELGVYLERATVFLSHSKHDAYGESIAYAIRDYIIRDTALASFFDVRDIPAGLSFADVIVRYVRTSAVVGIHTDSYSSREWCRKEIIEAKRANVPLIVADCITDIDERGFPYMGNVPIIRMEPRAIERIPHIIARLLDEYFKDYLWKARIAKDVGRTDVVFLPRPPELIALASSAIVRSTDVTQIVYPDPPLGAEEVEVFEAVRPGLVLRSYTDWASEHGGTP